MTDIGRAIAETKRVIEVQRRIGNILQKIKEYPNSIDVHYFVSKNDVTICIYELPHLTIIRKMLRAILGTWSDELDNQWMGCVNLITSWKPKDNSIPIEIWFECSPDNIPEELHKPGCRVVEVDLKEKRYVCGVDDV